MDGYLATLQPFPRWFTILLEALGRVLGKELGGGCCEECF